VEGSWRGGAYRPPVGTRRGDATDATVAMARTVGGINGDSGNIFRNVSARWTRTSLRTSSRSTYRGARDGRVEARPPAHGGPRQPGGPGPRGTRRTDRGSGAPPSAQRGRRSTSEALWPPEEGGVVTAVGEGSRTSGIPTLGLRVNRGNPLPNPLGRRASLEYMLQ
jgi:hypothetical protein